MVEATSWFTSGLNPNPAMIIVMILGNVLSLSEAQVPYLNNGNMNALLGGLL